jgi:hypothetical protein
MGKSVSVVQHHRSGFLTVAVNPAIALLHAIGIPGNLVVDQVEAMVL